jgi:hypothetical protein
MTAESNLVGFTLNQNYPNPCRHSTEISYLLPEDGLVILKVYNALGESIAELAHEKQAAGWHKLNVDVTSYAAGTYPFKLEFAGKENRYSQFKIMSKIN